MKKLALLVLPFLLSGCMVYNAYFTAKYDTNEYELITKIRTLATTTECGTSKVEQNAYEMWFYSVELKHFSQYIPKNEKANEMANKLVDITQGIHNKRGVMSQKYCEEKMKVIATTTEEIQRVLGSKPR